MAPKQPAILQVLPALNSGGVERGTCEIAKTIVDRSWQSYVASTGGGLVNELEKSGTRHVRISTLKSHVLVFYSAWQLYKIIKQCNIDLVHARSRLPAWACYWASKWAKVPMVTTFHGAYGCQNHFKYFYNSVMVKGERVIAPSQFIVDHIKKTYKVPCSKIDLIYRGVDLEQFYPSAVSTHTIKLIRKKWQVQQGEMVFLLPGRFTAIKGHEILLRALAAFKDKNWKLILMGSWYGKEKYFEYIKKVIVDLDLESHVLIEPAQGAVQEAYAAADIVVCPSIKPESFGRTIAEAGAMAKPVITTNIGGGAEIVVSNETGWLVQPNSVDDLRKALGQAFKLEPERLGEIGKAAEERIRKKFTLTAMQSKTIKLYESVLKV